MTMIPERLPELEALVLDTGIHDEWSEGACVMEAVSYAAGEPWSDQPDCASPVIGAFLRAWNDVLPVVDRQKLKPYIRRLVGSRGSLEQEDTRGWMALDWLVRTHTAEWLWLAGLTNQAYRLALLPEFKAGMDLASVNPTLEAIRFEASNARAAARWSAERTSARVAAIAAAWDAVTASAGTAAGAAAGAVEWDSARYAAATAARDAMGNAAMVAAGTALQPTVTHLQASAHTLIDRMLAVTGR